MRFRFGLFFRQAPFRQNLNFSSRGWFAKLLHDEHGSILIYLTLAVPVLLGVAALGTEGGSWLYQRRVLQSAADNAAYSAAAAYAADKTANYTTQARAVTANDYGLVDGQNNVTVAVNMPPSGSCVTGTSNYTGASAIEVVVTQSRAPLLAGMWLSNNVSICGRGVALVPSVGDCILALGSNSANPGIASIGKVNNLSITLQNCGIFSDSKASNSISLTGNNNTINAYSVGAAGGISVTGNAKSLVTNAITGAPPVADPYKADAASTWVASQTPAPSTPAQTCSGCSAGVATPTGGCSSGKNGVTTITLGAGNWTTTALNALNLSKCSTAINLSGGNYSLPGGFNWAQGGPLNVQAASNIVVTTGAFTTGTVNFGSGNYQVYVQSGDWTGTGTNGTTVNFGSGNYTIQASGSGNWKLAGVTFGAGNYNITLGGAWTLLASTTFGNGNYTFALTGDFVPSSGLTMGSGTYSGSMANWSISGSATIGSGIYYLSGSLTLSGNNATVTASNTTFVLTGTSSAIVSTGNHQTWTVTAPTTGWNAGIAIWEPNSTGVNQIATGNNSTATITGVIYAPKAEVDYIGNSGSTPTCTQIVADTVKFGGNSLNITGTCPGVPGLKLFGQIAALVE